MTLVRIAVASSPLTATLDDAVPAAITAIEAAARLGAAIVCLPETGLPGHRVQSRTVASVLQEAPGRPRSDASTQASGRNAHAPSMARLTASLSLCRRNLSRRIPRTWSL